MLVQNCWLSGLLFIGLTSALSSTISSHHLTGTTKTTTKSSSSTHHSSTSTTKKTTVTTSSTHHTLSTSTKSSTAAPTSTPSTYYLVAADTGQTAFDGTYFKLILDPFPSITFSGDKILQIGGKTPAGAANFTLNADGTLQCNTDSGPIVASVYGGHPLTMSFAFEPSAEFDETGNVACTCQTAKKILTCQCNSLNTFYLQPSDIVNGTQDGNTVDIGPAGDTGGGTVFTLQVVPT